MLSAGVDIGAENLKLVLLEDEKLLSYSIIPSGWDTKASLQHAFKEALELSGIDDNLIRCIGATGMGKENVSSATAYATDSTCSAKGVIWFSDSARTVIDIGAEQSQALTCDETGKVLEYARNENCAAGVGAFIEEIASALEVPVADMGELALRSEKEITINSTCAIFAESEVISLINEGVNKTDIAQAISNAIASKAAALLKCLNIKQDIVFIGGVAKNISVVNSLKKKLNMDIWVPEEPSLVTAIGAALISQKAVVKQ